MDIFDRYELRLAHFILSDDENCCITDRLAENPLTVHFHISNDIISSAYDKTDIENRIIDRMVEELKRSLKEGEKENERNRN